VREVALRAVDRPGNRGATIMRPKQRSVQRCPPRRFYLHPGTRFDRCAERIARRFSARNNRMLCPMVPADHFIDGDHVEVSQQAEPG